MTNKNRSKIFKLIFGQKPPRHPGLPVAARRRSRPVAPPPPPPQRLSRPPPPEYAENAEPEVNLNEEWRRFQNP